MATQKSTLAPCSQRIIDEGTAVFRTHHIPLVAMEKWVKKVAERSGQKVDWYNSCGSAVVMALGDISAVRDMIIELQQEHNDLYWDVIKEKYPGIYDSKRPANKVPGTVLYEDS